MLDGNGETTGALTTIRNNSDLVSYGVSVKTRAQTNDYRDVDWSTELSNLGVISDNISTLKSYNNSTVSKETNSSDIEAIAGVIGSTLDAIEGSTLISDNSDKVIANKVIKQITNITPNPELDNNDSTWTEVFENAIGVYVEGLKLLP